MVIWDICRAATHITKAPSQQTAQLEQLAPSEREQYQTLTTEKRQQEFLATRLLAKQLVSAQLGGKTSDWIIDGGLGKPLSVRDRATIFLSISHSADWIACAVSDQPVGIDIEVINPKRESKRDFLGIAARICSPDELNQLHALPSDALSKQFYKFWTCKEAWLKQRGLGLDFELMKRITAIEDDGNIRNALVLQDMQIGLTACISHQLMDSRPLQSTYQTPLIFDGSESITLTDFGSVSLTAP